MKLYCSQCGGESSCKESATMNKRDTKMGSSLPTGARATNYGYQGPSSNGRLGHCTRGLKFPIGSICNYINRGVHRLRGCGA